jgi:hypothetical protein
MASREVANGEDSLQIWSVTVNILNKQLRTADRGCPSTLGDGRGANNPQFLRKITISRGQENGHEVLNVERY